MSAAYDSVMRLSFEVQAGLLMRQVHHWTALVFLGAIAVHLARVFFTGAFRRPREINWLIGLGLLLLALGEGITGYSLPGRPPVRDRPPDHRLGHAVDPVRRPVGRVAVLRRRVPDAGHPQPPVRVPRDAAAGPADRRHRRPPRAGVAAEAHPVPHGADPRGQRRRAALLAGPGLPIGRAVLPDRGGGHARRRPDPDQPGLAVRARTSLCRHRAGAAGLVRRLARGRAAPGAADRADHPRASRSRRRSCPAC